MNLNRLTANEHAEVLQRLLQKRPELKVEAERLASKVIANTSAGDVARSVKLALTIDHTRIGELSGYQPGSGYVEPSEAAYWLLEEAVEPFERDIERLMGMGLRVDAQERAMGLIDGLFRGSDEASDDTVLSWCPDFADERAPYLLQRWEQLGLDLPTDRVLEVLPDSIAWE